MLLDALWDVHRVDEGRDSALSDARHQFTRTLEVVSAELGAPWDRGDQQDVWTGCVRDCCRLRNETAHEGRPVTSKELDRAFVAYDALRRVALLVHGRVGLRANAALTGRVAAEHRAVQEEDGLTFWLPHDLRDRPKG